MTLINAKRSIAEFDAFKRLTDALEIAASAARDVGQTRPDQSRKWDKVSEALSVVRESCFRLAGEGTTGKHDS